MEITEVRIKLMEDSDDRLQAFCSITFDDCFVVRDLKIIEGSNGPFVAMPSRKLTALCPECGCKNHLRSSFCNYCGEEFEDEPLPRDSSGRTKLYADIAHPINSACREMVQARVIKEFQGEKERAQQPGYRSRYDDEYDAGCEGDELESDSQHGSKAKRRTDPPEASGRKAHRKAARPAGTRQGAETEQDRQPAEPDQEAPQRSKPHTQLQPAENRVPAPHTRSDRSGEEQEESSKAKNSRPADAAEEGRKGRPDDNFGAGIF